MFVIVFQANNDIAGKTSTVWCIAMCFYGSLSLARSLSGALIAAVGTQRSVSGRVACQHLEARLMTIKTQDEPFTKMAGGRRTGRGGRWSRKSHAPLTCTHWPSPGHM